MRKMLVLSMVAASVLMAHPAEAATFGILIHGFAFDPNNPKIAQGDSVTWTNHDGQNHTSASRSAGTGTFDLWHTGAISFNETSDPVRLTNAGKYFYICTLHDGMTGFVTIGVAARPGQGSTGTTFRIIWGSANPPQGYNADIQIKRPGSSMWVDWRTNQTTTRQANFTPDAGTGSYQFRARLQKGTSGFTVFSPAKRITVS